MSPLFITFEGGEGAGKSTLINKIENQLTHQGFKVVRTREPGGTSLGEYLRNCLLNRNFQFQIGAQAELLLFLASRVQQIEECIRPALKEGKIVLCDRFNDSTIVYQGVARGLGLDYVQNLCQFVCGDLVPNLTFFLDVDPLVGLLRTQKVIKEHANAGEMDRLESEKLAFHENVRKGFQILAQQHSDRIYTLDANEEIDKVFAKACKILEQKLKLNMPS